MTTSRARLFRANDRVRIRPERLAEWAGRARAGGWAFRFGDVLPLGLGPTASGRFVYVRWDGNRSADQVPVGYLELGPAGASEWAVEGATTG